MVTISNGLRRRASIFAIFLNLLILFYKIFSVGDVFTGTPFGAFAYLGSFLYLVLVFYSTPFSARRSLSESAKPDILLIVLVVVTPLLLYPIWVNFLTFLSSDVWVATSSFVGILLIIESSSKTAFILLHLLSRRSGRLRSNELESEAV